MQKQTLWIISALAAATLFGVFLKLKQGFGPMNLRVVGIVLVAFLSSILATSNPDTLNAVMGIFGAIAGYLFGTKEKEKEKT
jgi:cytochrome c biogenesis factor